MLYIGIDLGTSAVKLLLMDETGKVLNIVSKEYPLSFPNPGWSEQNPSDWWAQSKAGLKELTANVDKNSIAGISFGGQMHGLVVLDENDEVIRPAIPGMTEGHRKKQTISITRSEKKNYPSLPETLHLQDLPHRRYCGLRRMNHRTLQRSKDHASKGLYSISSDRRVQYGLF